MWLMVIWTSQAMQIWGSSLAIKKLHMGVLSLPILSLVKITSNFFLSFNKECPIFSVMFDVI